MALLEKKGYGQVEPNHLSGQATKQLYAALPVAETVIEATSQKAIENGMFLVYDMASDAMTTDYTAGEPMLVFSEVKLYHPWESYKDFALTKAKSSDGKVYPRLIKTNVGDHFTTNLVDITTAFGPALKGVTLTPVNGILTEQAPAEGQQAWKVVKCYNLADNQRAVKVQRVK